jgi:hypothetical protein
MTAALPELPSGRELVRELTEWLQNESNASPDGRQRRARLSHKNDLRKLPGLQPSNFAKRCLRTGPPQV